MKLNKLLLVFFLWIFSVVYGQMESWYKVDLGTLGYKHNQVGFYKTNSMIPDSRNYYQDSSLLSFKGGSTELSADIFTEHVYFHLDGSVVTDFTIALMAANKKDWWFNQSYGRYDQLQLLPMRLAFGDNITPYFGIYAGGQWQYSLFNYTPSNQVPYDEQLIGGHQYGLGLHATLAVGPVLIRHSYMYDWITRARHFRGLANVHETACYVGWPSFGFFTKMNFYNRKMFEGTYSQSLSAILHSDLKVNEQFYEMQQMKQFTLSFGIYAAGLFSGVSRGTAKSLQYIETENRNERNRKKRSTIEYKD